MRNARHPACLQNGHAAHDLHDAAARIAYADDAAPPLPAPSREPRREHGKERRDESVAHPDDHLVEDRGIGRRRARMVLRELGDPRWILR